VDEAAHSDDFQEELVAAIKNGDREGSYHRFCTLLDQTMEDGSWRRVAGFWAVRDELDRAERIFESIRSERVNDTVATLAVALCAEERGDFHRTEKLCLDVLTAAHNDPRPLELLVDLYARSGLVSETEGCLLRLSELLPKQTRLWVALGNLYFLCGEMDSAKSALDKALAIEEADADALYGVARWHQLRGEADQAKEKLRTLLVRRPDDPLVSIALGFTHLLENLPQLAEARFRAVAERDAPQDVVQLGLAQAALLRRSYEEAWRLTSPLLAKAPENLQILCAAWSAANGAGYSAKAEELRAKLTGRLPPEAFAP
jgi:predicted Zn-dependent protease